MKIYSVEKDGYPERDNEHWWNKYLSLPVLPFAEGEDTVYGNTVMAWDHFEEGWVPHDLREGGKPSDYDDWEFPKFTHYIYLKDLVKTDG